MQSPLEITFRGMSPSRSVEGAVARWLARLEQTCDRIQSCSVVIEQPHHHRARGNRFHVRIDLTVPGTKIAVSRDTERDPGHENAYVAVADAFRTARRLLQEHARIQRSGANRHERGLASFVNSHRA
jgi:hypothetical protein